MDDNGSDVNIRSDEASAGGANFEGRREVGLDQLGSKSGLTPIKDLSLKFRENVREGHVQYHTATEIEMESRLVSLQRK